MGYREKFAASQDKAHYQNIATKIDREMRDLRSQAEDSPTAPRRWVWELIQNAKDVHIKGSVNIQIQFNTSPSKNEIIFSHTGKPFTADNIRFLIEQISTKDRSRDQKGNRKTTGKFGTGFLSTHLLSETVTINSVAKELEYRQFELNLDRGGNNLHEIINAVQAAKKSVENLDDLQPYTSYQEGAYHTFFTYPLNDNVGVDIAKKGLNDLKNCLPYSFIFVPEIKTLTVFPYNLHFQALSRPLKEHRENTIEFNNVQTQSNTNENSIFTIATLTKGLTTIAVPVIIEGSNVIIQQISNKTPKLFCDFPLVGTETFPFPVIINNPHFNPTDPRDGIFLTSGQRENTLADENNLILKEAIHLFFELLNTASTNNWKNLHLLANIGHLKENSKWISREWHTNNILTPIQTQLLYAKIVNTANGEAPVSILQDNGVEFMQFPHSHKKELRLKIWELANEWFPHAIPRKEDIEIWHQFTWKDCGRLTTDRFAKFVEDQQTTSQLSTNINKTTCINWLNDFYSMLSADEKEYDSIINKRSIFPNQIGNFCQKEILYKDNGDLINELVEVLAHFGNDVRNRLADNHIDIEIPEDRKLGLSDLVKEISNEVMKKHSNPEKSKNDNEAFKILLNWFKHDPNEARKNFPDLYNRKHLLYNEDEIMENMDKAEQLDGILNDCGASNLEELRKLIKRGETNTGSLLPITEEIIANMGITSIEDWEEAIQDKDLASLFSHESTPTTDMFIYAQSLIEKAKQKVIEYLNTQTNYDTTELEEIAPTVLSGIKKDDKEINIVVRPAYSGEVIIYYGAERDVLDYESAELWIDNGAKQKQITLGHILKKAEIRKFPI